jgi:hypothetical protein
MQSSAGEDSSIHSSSSSSSIHSSSSGSSREDAGAARLIDQQQQAQPASAAAVAAAIAALKAGVVQQKIPAGVSAHQMQSSKLRRTLWTAVLQLRTPDAALKQQLHAALLAPSTVRGMLVALRLLLLNQLQQAAAGGLAVESGVVQLAQLVAAACSTGPAPAEQQQQEQQQEQESASSANSSAGMRLSGTANSTASSSAAAAAAAAAATAGLSQSIPISSRRTSANCKDPISSARTSANWKDPISSRRTSTNWKDHKARCDRHVIKTDDISRETIALNEWRARRAAQKANKAKQQLAAMQDGQQMVLPPMLPQLPQLQQNGFAQHAAAAQHLADAVYSGAAGSSSSATLLQLVTPGGFCEPQYHYQQQQQQQQPVIVYLQQVLPVVDASAVQTGLVGRQLPGSASYLLAADHAIDCSSTLLPNCGTAWHHYHHQQQQQCSDMFYGTAVSAPTAITAAACVPAAPLTAAAAAAGTAAPGREEYLSWGTMVQPVHWPQGLQDLAEISTANTIATHSTAASWNGVCQVPSSSSLASSNAENTSAAWDSVGQLPTSDSRASSDHHCSLTDSTTAANTSPCTGWDSAGQLPTPDLDSIVHRNAVNPAAPASQGATAGCPSVWQVQTTNIAGSGDAAAGAWDSACQLPCISKLSDSLAGGGNAAAAAAATKGPSAGCTAADVLQLPTPDSHTSDGATTSTGSAVNAEAAAGWVGTLQLLSLN